MSEQLWDLRSPRGGRATKQRENAPRLHELRGTRIGIMDDGFPNAAVVLDRIRERLSARGDLSLTGYRRHRSVGYFDPKELLEDFVKDCDAVIVGVGA
ncbi:MAG: hypothetical protein HYX92_03185 [Chloroflexi bacterium]|nr:hypothetical protein [Chloroflexota bacterium]